MQECPLILSSQPKTDNRQDATNHGTDTRTISFTALLVYAWFTYVISYVLYVQFYIWFTGVL